MRYNVSMSLARDFPQLFWDLDPLSLDEERHAEFVIERVLEEGTLDAVRVLWRRFGPERIVGVVCRSRRISRRTARFWQAYLDIREPIACLQTPSPRPLSAHWER